MDKVAQELTSVPLATTVSAGLRSAAFMSQTIDVEATSQARGKSEEVLLNLMETGGVIEMDPDLAIRAFQVLSAHEIALLEAQRKFMETRMEVYKTLAALQDVSNDVSSEDANELEDKNMAADPLQKIENSFLP